ncbi:MAG: hypothetical protein BGP21_06305 [Thiobacillus sp. 65-29]|jgi:MSHA biogenesis protein MshK|nr:MAG: hypothetical protein BGP21_06305 [Thiobacillus sp. 65-29]
MAARLISLVLLAALAASPAQAELPDPTAPPPRADSVEAPPPVALTAIRSSGAQRVAILDGRSVRVGDRYQGARVVRIDETEVTLRRGSETVVLKLHPEAETRRRKQ